MEWALPPPPIPYHVVKKLPCKYMMSYRTYFSAEKEKTGLHNGTFEPPSNPDLQTCPLSYSVFNV